MPNTIKITRTQATMALCLPLALLLGYMLSDPMQLSTRGLVALFFGVLLAPFLIKYYHPLLVFSINTVFVFELLPGAPSLWMLAALIGFFFAVVNRCMDWNRRLIVGGNIARSLLVLTVVVFVTAYLRGGAGVAAFGGSSFGGRRYFVIALSIMAYFALASQQVPAHQRKLYASLFFLSGLTSMFSLLVDFGGSGFSVLSLIVPPDYRGGTDMSLSNVRLFGFAGICSAGLLYLAARFGLEGILSNFWRTMLVVVLFGASLLTGFRSTFGFLLLIFVVLFFLEGLHRTRYLLVAGVIGVLLMLSLAMFAEKLPWQMQRALSFLPVRVNILVKEDAKSSVDWRVEMWKVVIGQVPQYFWEGKGYAMDPGELYMSQVNSFTKLGADTSDWANTSGDYHNGPLSLIIPFGIWGVIAFVWFLTASARMLYRNMFYGDPELKTVNTVFLAYFIAKTFFFFFLVGGFYGDLISFTSVAGLSICLNSAYQIPERKEWSPVLTLATQRIAKDL